MGDTLDNASDGLTHEAVQAANSLGDPAVATAALDANAGKSPADPMDASIAALHARVTQLESFVAIVAPAVATAVPSLKPALAGLVPVETAVNDALTAVQANSSLLSRLAHFFDTHLQSKV